MQVIGFNVFGSIEVVIDGVLYAVPDNMENSHRQMIAEWEAQGNTIPPYEAPDEPEPVTVLYPADLWRRVTDDEAALIVGAMDQQPLRVRKIFETAQVYRSDDEMWSLLHDAAVTLFGEERAAVILAPSEEG